MALEDSIRHAKGMFRKYVDAHTKGAGQRTLVNGFAVEAMWEAAQAERVQSFLSESDWAKNVYIVTFPFKVYQPPWLLKAGASIKNVRWNSDGVARRADAEGEHKWIALVVMGTRT